MTPKEKILNEVALIAHSHNLALRDLMVPARFPHIVKARNHAMWHIRTVHGYSFPRIGAIFGIHHATVIHGIAAHMSLKGIENEYTMSLEKKRKRARDRFTQEKLKDLALIDAA